MNKIEMLDKNITMEDIHFALTNANSNIICMYNDYNSDNLVFRIRLTKSTLSNKKKKNKLLSDSLDQSDEIYLLKNLQDELLNSLVLRGIKNIKKVILRKITDNVEEIDMKYIKKEEWVLDTVGTNLLEILSLDFIDTSRTTSNDIIEIYKVLGIEAARQAIFDEFSEVIEFDSTYINYHHLTMLCDRMTCNNKMISIFRHGINNDDIGPIAKASFEETPEMFLRAAKHGELDMMKGVSSNIMCGQQGYFGTNCFKVLSDIEYMMSINQADSENKDEDDKSNNYMSIDDIESQLNDTEDDLHCNIENLRIHTNVENIKTHTILDDDYEIDF